MTTHQPLSDSAWIDECVQHVRRHAPAIHQDTGRDCAIDMRRCWPTLTPAKAADCYFSPAVDMGPVSVLELA
jgi:hypothetical protein